MTDTEFKQFLSDVMTAAGLVAHGKQSKALAERLGERVMKLCATPPSVPDFADAYQGAMEEVAIWKKRALEAEALNRKFMAEINGPTHMGEPVATPPSVPDGWVEWLVTEIDAIDARYRGDPAYDHDAYWMKEQVIKLIESHKAMLSAAMPPSVPDGFVLVPVEPTPEMLYAAFAADKEYSARMFGSTDAVVSVGAYDHYVAMLAAAPKPGDE